VRARPSQRLLVAPPLEGDEPESFDLLICAHGYEPRCTHVFERVGTSARRHVVLSFADHHVGAYDDAAEKFESGGAEPVELEDDEVSLFVRQQLATVEGESVRLGVDVSSFSRLRAAHVLEELYSFVGDRSTSLTLLYSPAAYSPPPPPLSPLAILEPVTEAFAGLEADPELPVVALVGVGYEEQRALGVIEFLEASDAWILVPTGYDSRFDDAVTKSNRLLLSRLADHRVDYSFQDYSIFGSVQSLAHSLRSNYRVVMVPMGPKLLAASCLMVSLLSGGTDAVWRASSGSLETPRPAQASGEIVRIRLMTPDLLGGPSGDGAGGPLGDLGEGQ
jgi:hypothetical protein